MQEIFSLKQKKCQIEKMIDEPKFKSEILALNSDDQEIEMRIGPFLKK